jgi:hypothetical protein
MLTQKAGQITLFICLGNAQPDSMAYYTVCLLGKYSGREKYILHCSFAWEILSQIAWHITLFIGLGNTQRAGHITLFIRLENNQSESRAYYTVYLLGKYSAR